MRVWKDHLVWHAFALAKQHPVKDSAAVEANCQRRVIAVHGLEVVQVAMTELRQ
jgi:hypothetical protein